MRLFTKKIASLIGIVGSGLGLTTYSAINGVKAIPSLSFNQDRLNSSWEGFIDSNKLLIDSSNIVESASSHPKIFENNILMFKEGNHLDLNDQNQLGKGLPLFKAGDAFNELKKIDKIKEVGRRSVEAIKEARDRFREEETQILKKVVQKYRDYSSANKPRRRRREIESVISTEREKPSLDNRERRSLFKHYGQFVHLNELKNTLISELDNLSKRGENIEERREIKKEQDKLKGGVSSLKTIRWDYPNLKLFGGQYGDQRKDILDPQRVRSWKNIECNDDHCGWVNWEDNPYRNFFKDEGEWKKFIFDITTPQKKILEKLDDPKKIACGFLFFPGVKNFFSYYGVLWFLRKAYIWKNGPELKNLSESDCGVSEQKFLFKEIDKAKKELQFKIGSDLLKRMSLLNSSH